MRISRERFEELAFDIARELLARLPADLRAEAETVILEIADEPESEQIPEGSDSILGLYEGVPLIERHHNSVILHPDRVTLYQEPLQQMARTEVELRRQIRKTLIHELGHFFGFNEDELRQRGWG